MDVSTTMKRSPSSDSPSANNSALSLSNEMSYSEHNQMPPKLWWSPKRNQVEIPSEVVKYRNVRSKVGSLANIEYQPGGGQVMIQDKPLQWKASSRVDSLSNITWSSSTPRVSIQQEKLKWNARSKVNSLDNINHKPGGGVVEVYDEKPDFGHVTSRTDSGFAN